MHSVPQSGGKWRNGGVVDVVSCAEEDASANTGIDDTTHIALIVHPRALGAIAERLAQRID